MAARDYLVVEVLDPVIGLDNIYIPVHGMDPAAVANGFKALAADGIKPTGAFSRVTRAFDGTIVRREAVREPLFLGGWRTRSSHLR